MIRLKGCCTFTCLKTNLICRSRVGFAITVGSHFHVFGARLHITALRTAAGLAIELLEYMAPRDGRPYPADSKANDIWHWQIHAITTNPDEAFNVLRPAKATFVSTGSVALPNKRLGFNKGLLIRDPDGHALLLQP